MELEELGTREKQSFGQGVEHIIYSSPNKPNVVYKVGEWDVINEWYDIFKSNPQIFPVVYKIGKIPKDGLYYVELEKLDTEKFENAWDDLELALEDLGFLDIDRGENFTDLYLFEGTSSAKFIEIGKKLSEYNPEMYNFYVKLLVVIKNAEKAQREILKKDTLVDAHKYNFGYSKDGKLKCLDI